MINVYIDSDKSFRFLLPALFSCNTAVHQLLSKQVDENKMFTKTEKLDISTENTTSNQEIT